MIKKVIIILIIISSSVRMVKSQNCNFLCNGDFENPVYGHWTDVADSLFPCWQTTESDSIIEVWWNGYDGVPSYHGNQFIELNANAVSTVYQNFLIAAGTHVVIGFAHRGRAGIDTMSISIGPVGGPYVTLGKYADGNTAWGYYTVNYTIPIGFGNYYCLRLNSIYAAGNNPGLGNFVDDISVIPSPALAASTSSNNVLCYNGTDGSATVTVSSGLSPYTYQWSPSGGTSMTVTGLSAGIYTCLITDANGCSTMDTVIVTQPAQALNCTIPANTSVICNGVNTGSTNANVSGGTGPYTYNWSPGGETTATISDLSAGTYTVTVNDANGCTTTASITLTQAPVLSSSIANSTNVTCYDANTGSASAIGSGGTSPYTYSWLPGGETTAAISNLSAGIYTVTVEGANGCTTTTTVTITQPPLLYCSIPTITNVSCYGYNTGSAIVGGNGGVSPYTYNWSPGGETNASINNLSAGTYTVTVNDANGCTATAMTTITQPQQLECTIPSVINIRCDGGNTGSASAIGSGGTSPYIYNWSPGGETNATVSNLSAGTYTVTISDANGCTGSVSATIITQPAALFACCDKTIISGGSDTIIADSSEHYNWSPSTSLNCDTCQIVIASPTVTTTYTVTGTDGNGCTLERIVTVTVENICADFTVPNVFTPNNDGLNDKFVIKAENVDKYSIIIYDRWGIEMYQSTDPTIYWNGLTESGGKAPEGVYYYLINVTCQGNTYKKDGFVQLIR